MSFQPEPHVPVTQPKTAKTGVMTDQQAEEVLKQILGGELPGEGYLIPPTPADRVLVPIDAEKVRGHLLRAVEACAIAGQEPYSSEKHDEAAAAALRFAQSYLLLDPKVDAEGVDVQGRAEAIAAAAPPRVPPTAAQEAFKGKNKGKDEVIRNDRPQRPRPAKGAGG